MSRLIDISKYEVLSFQNKSQDFVDGVQWILEQMDKELTVKAIPPCEDCVSRQAVLEGLASIAKAKAKSDAQKSLMGRVMFFVEQMPSVQQKTGHWIWCGGSHECSNCGEYTCFSHKKPLRYCPNCGAKMESEE